MEGTQNNEGQGPMIGVVLVMAILIIGGVYMLFTRLNQNPLSSPISGPNATSGQVELTSTSTEVNSLEADAAKIDVSSLNDDITNFDQAVK